MSLPALPAVSIPSVSERKPMPRLASSAGLDAEQMDRRCRVAHRQVRNDIDVAYGLDGFTRPTGEGPKHTDLFFFGWRSARDREQPVSLID